MFSPMDLPFTVIVSVCKSLASKSSPITAGTPPLLKKASPKKSPAGCMFNKSGISKPTFCQSFTDNDTPACLAIAWRCGGALVDPPIAELTIIAFSNDFLVKMSEGLRSSYTISTILFPVE